MGVGRRGVIRVGFTMCAGGWDLQHFVSPFECVYLGGQDGWLNDKSGKSSSCKLLLCLFFKIRSGFYCEAVICLYCVCVCARQRGKKRWGLVSGINNGVKEQQSQRRMWFSGEVYAWNCTHVDFCLFVCESVFVPVHVDCVCVCVYVFESMSRMLNTDKTGLAWWILLIPFLVQWAYRARSVWRKKGARRLWETKRNKRGFNKQADKTVFIIYPLIEYAHLIYTCVYKDHNFNKK